MYRDTDRRRLVTVQTPHRMDALCGSKRHIIGKNKDAGRIESVVPMAMLFSVSSKTVTR